MKVINVAVEGMTCNHCVKHVTEALEEVEGVVSVKVSLEDNKATLEVEENFSDRVAAGALDDAGYKLGEVSPT